MIALPLKIANAGPYDAPDFNILIGKRWRARHARIARFEIWNCSSKGELANDKATVHNRNDNMSILRLSVAVNHDYIVIIEACVYH
jgi:hypothetical protein